MEINRKTHGMLICMRFSQKYIMVNMASIVHNLINLNYNILLTKKALLAIKYGNGGVIRAYYCKCCRCYHTTCRQTFESGKYVPKQKHVNKYKDLKHG